MGRVHEAPEKFHTRALHSARRPRRPWRAWWTPSRTAYAKKLGVLSKRNKLKTQRLALGMLSLPYRSYPRSRADTVETSQIAILAEV